MFNLKFLIGVVLLFTTSCSETTQNNGFNSKKFNQIKVEIGKTTKKSLIYKYGPPIFESVFNNNVLYYVSHDTSYKLLGEPKTKRLLVYEINFNDKDIVKSFQKYSKEDSYDVIVSNKQSKDETNFTFIIKELINNMRRNNLQN